jgi:hypothetical protein
VAVPLFWAAATLASAFRRDSSLPFHFSLAAVFAVGGFGLWMLARKEPGGPYFDDRWIFRWALRLLACGVGLSGIAFGLLEVEWVGNSFGGIDEWQPRIGWLAFPGAMVLVMVLLPLYLAGLSGRLPGRRLRRWGKLVPWSCPGAGVFLLMLLLLPYQAISKGVGEWILFAVILPVMLAPSAYAMTWAVVVWRRAKAK